MKVLTSFVLALTVFVMICFLDAILLGEVKRGENAVFAGIVGAVALVNLFVIAKLRKRNR
jgi:hypothetical protein